MRLATLGYEGLSIDEFLALLKANQVQILVDVRELPLSRKKGFSKTALSTLAAGQGIGYVHLRALGCPRNIRHDYRKDKDWARYTERFLAYLQTQGEALAELAELTRQGTSCLVCFEADHRLCHRSFVAEALAEVLGPELVIQHLRA